MIYKPVFDELALIGLKNVVGGAVYFTEGPFPDRAEVRRGSKKVSKFLECDGFDLYDEDLGIVSQVATSEEAAMFLRGN